MDKRFHETEHPVVPLSRDKGRSKNPGTKSLFQKTKKQEKDILKQEKDVLKQGRISRIEKGRSKTGKDVLKQEIIEKNSDCPVPHPVKDFDRKVFIVPSRVSPNFGSLSRPFLWQDSELVRCLFVLGQ